MLEIKGKCGVCQQHFRRPAAARVPDGYCTTCWELSDQQLQERDDLADRHDSDHLRGVRKMVGTDPGAHYRWEIRRRITDDDIARGWVSVKVDPYRIARVAGLGGGPHEHSVKKLLRGEAKGHEARELIREVRCCLDRWSEMLDEDEEEARCR